MSPRFCCPISPVRSRGRSPTSTAGSRRWPQGWPKSSGGQLLIRPRHRLDQHYGTEHLLSANVRLRQPAAHYDAVIIGGGHNGLVCACYLAGGGLKVGVFERRAVVGGAAVTEEFYPGFRNSTASYTVSLLHPQVIR